MRAAAKQLLRLVTFEAGGIRRVGAHVENEIVDFAAASAALPRDMRSFLEAGADALSAARDIVSSGKCRLPLQSARILAPISNPEKVICIGLNYVDHARECGAALPTEPVVFCKFPSCIINPGDSIVLPRISKQVDYEAELVAVIGTPGRNISEENAMKHVVGFSCGHDVSARDWQLGRPGGQWLLGKTFDTFAPIGPSIVVYDPAQYDPHSLSIRLLLNGKPMQDGNTRDLVFKTPALVAHVSRFVTLRPGDLIFTGTPAGVGMGRRPQVFLKAGDEVVVDIEGLGQLRNPVVDEA